MKKHLVTLFILIFITSYSQDKRKITLKDSNELGFVSDANVYLDDKYYTKSNSIGEFEIDIEIDFDTLKITHVSYDEMLLSFEDLKLLKEIELTTNAEQLQLLVIKKNNEVSVFPDRLKLYKYGLSLSHGSQVGLFIPNNFNDVRRIKKILIETTKDLQDLSDDEIEYLSFKVNLFTVDSLTGFPHKEILKDDLVASKVKGNRFVEIVLEESIEFSTKGIFVIAKILDEQESLLYNNSLKTPFFRTLTQKEDTKFVEFYKRNEKSRWQPRWNDAYYDYQCFNFGIVIE
mgnify:CR=1 FL=1